VIIRTPNRERYVIISKVPLEDLRLSWKARGLLSYLLSKPDEWKVIITHLVEQAPDGEESVRAGLKELEGAGYIRRTQSRGAGSKFDSVNTEVFEEPCVFPDKTASGFSASGKTAFGKTGTNEYMILKNNERRDISSRKTKKQPRGAEPFKDDFEEIWSIYPRGVNRREAYKKYSATRQRGIDQETLFKAVQEYARSREGQDEKFTLHGATFFGPNERWRDFLPVSEIISDDDMESAIAYDLYDAGEAWCFEGEETFDNPAKFGIQRVVDGRGNLIDAQGRAYEIDGTSGKRKYMTS
jgi:hypothetical protein